MKNSHKFLMKLLKNFSIGDKHNTDMKLIVGLGNPGSKYEKTRHNIGFMAVEKFLKDFEPERKTEWENSVKFKSDIVELEWQPHHGSLEKVILAKPKTYMNNSGMAVSVISSQFSVHSSDIWIIHDDIDLPLGTLRIRFGGGTAGHRGLESIIESLGTGEFWRFRMGIGKPQKISNFKFQISNSKGVEDYVLGSFIGQDRSKVKQLLVHTSKAIQLALEQDLHAAMNKCNTK